MYTPDMQTYIKRTQENEIKKLMSYFPVVAIIGPRQCGKSTLAKHILASINDSIYLDLEDIDDWQQLSDAKQFFVTHQNRTICIDEVQRKPELFTTIRSIVDTYPNIRILLLGSASPDLLRQTSETLAGRIAYTELTPFTIKELNNEAYDLYAHWVRGGFPDSFLAPDTSLSFHWRMNFLRTFVEKDLPQLGIHIPSLQLQKFLRLISHYNGQVINYAKMAQALEVSNKTLKSYIQLFEQTFLLRTLQPYETNTKKRLVKSPKLYVRDTGILHSLLKIADWSELLGSPTMGNSWESFVLENIWSEFEHWEKNFYRTSSGTEIDLVLQKGTNRPILIECKSSTNAHLSKGFWQTLEDLDPQFVWVMTPLSGVRQLRDKVFMGGMESFFEHCQSYGLVST